MAGTQCGTILSALEQQTWGDSEYTDSLAAQKLSRMSAEAFASLDSMEGIELPRPRAHPPSRTGIWSRLGLVAALCVAAAAWGVHLLFPPFSAAFQAHG